MKLVDLADYWNILEDDQGQTHKFNVGLQGEIDTYESKGTEAVLQ